MAQSNPTVKQATLTRDFDAPRDLIFAAWTEPEHFAQWCGPQGFSVPVVEMDVRTGGTFRIEMKSPDGSTYPTKGTFTDVTPPERLVMIDIGMEGPDGTSMMELQYTVTFEDLGGKTRLTLTIDVLKAAPEFENVLEGAQMGFTQAFEKLEAHLESAAG